jgi:hypothetical protein
MYVIHRMSANVRIWPIAANWILGVFVCCCSGCRQNTVYVNNAHDIQTDLRPIMVSNPRSAAVQAEALHLTIQATQLIDRASAAANLETNI